MTLLDHILTAFLPSANRWLTALRRQLFSALRPDRYNVPVTVRRILTNSAPSLAATIRKPMLTAWLAPTYSLSRDSFSDGDDLPPATKLIQPGGTPNKPGYLFHEAGLNWLADKQIVPFGMLKQLDATAAKNAEFMAYATTQETAKRLGAALDSAIREGGTVKQLRDAVGDAFDRSPLSESQLENLYRTNGGRVYAAGQQYALSHPLVGSEFPFVLYSATHDSRTRHTHIALESLGLNGTAVYWVNDPVIKRYWAPWEWGCRCHCISLSVADAARHGVEAAQEWMHTGVQPDQSKLLVPDPLFRLPKGWQPVSGWRFPSPIV